jgi:hypothetical protein
VSADNWARCPRCTAWELARLDSETVKIQQLYGAVSVEEFNKASDALADDRAAFERRSANFREDYEIYGAESGSVTVSYSGSCEDCGLSLHFQEEHEIPLEPTEGATP